MENQGAPPGYSEVYGQKQEPPYPAPPQVVAPVGQPIPYQPGGPTCTPQQGMAAYPPPQGGLVYAPQNQQNSTVVVTTGVAVAPIGSCPVCRVGALVEGFSCCGIVLAIIFFPIGILCCMCMREKQCTNCGATF